MSHQKMSIHRAQTLSFSLFLICLAILTTSNHWWPEIMVAIGICLALRQYLLGKKFDMMVSLIVFLGTYITIKVDIAWEIVFPTIFILSAIYLLLKEFISPGKVTEEDKEDEINEELKEDK
jgi:hypothetical protein